jgi:hypothetical protein
MVKGTSSDNVIEVLEKIPEDKRKEVKEVTLDMAASMQKIVITFSELRFIVFQKHHV